MGSGQKRLKVAVLVDLPRSTQSGGHVKGWESRAEAVAAAKDLPLDLTVYFSGAPRTETLSPHVRLRQLPPVFSTRNLPFLPYVPDHTDLAPYHFALAKELPAYDVIHTTDAYFAFARTAERISKKHAIPLTTSFHTDTPSYSRIFTANTIRSIFGENAVSHFLIDRCRLPERQEQKMLRRLREHLACCSDALLVRPEDAALAGAVIGKERVHFLSAVTDKKRFSPKRANRKDVETDYKIPPDRLLVLFVGRLDIGKNIYTLLEAMEKLASRNVPVHLVTAGLGPAAKDLKERLGPRVTVAGFIAPDSLAQLMASSDILAFPSEVEMRSFVAVEALASGLPVLVTKKSGIGELLQTNGALEMIDGGAEAWANALEKLATSPALVAKMHEAARSYGEEAIADWEGIMRNEFLTVWQKAHDERIQRA